MINRVDILDLTIVLDNRAPPRAGQETNLRLRIPAPDRRDDRRGVHHVAQVGGIRN